MSGVIATLAASARPWIGSALRRVGLRRSGPAVPRLSAADVLHAEDVPTRVTCRADETILVNGRPFFPIGLYYADAEMHEASGNQLAELRAIGFNAIAFRGGLDSNRLLNRIHNAGLYVWYRPPGELHGAFETLRHIVARFGRHPAVLFWDMADEPLLNGLPFAHAKLGSDFVRRLDAFHPILCNQWLPGRERATEVARWATLSDVHGFAMYPVPVSRLRERLIPTGDASRASLAIVGEQTRLWRALAPGKPVIPALQAFAWNALEDGDAGFPSVRESRFMAYHAIVNGAKGLHYFGVRTPDAPCLPCGIPPSLHSDLDRAHDDFVRAREANARYWRRHANVVRELSALSHVFTAPTVDWPLHVAVTSAGGSPSNGSSIEWLVKQLDDAFVVLLVNASDDPIDLALSAPHLAGRTLHVWTEGRSLRVNANGTLHDRISPYGVRIYSDAHGPLTAFTGDPGATA